MVFANTDGVARQRATPFSNPRSILRSSLPFLFACCFAGNALAQGEQSETFNGQEIRYSENAPLAAKDLLLDIEQVGDGYVAVGQRGHILLSSDGETWAQAGSVPNRSTLTAVDFRGQHGWVVGHDAVILHSADGGQSWELQYFDPDLDQPLLNVRFLDDQTGYAVGAYGFMLRTEDGGENWDEAYVSEEDDFFLNDIVQLEDGSLMVLAEAGNAYVSTDAGESWEWVELPYAGSMFGALVLPNNTVLAYGLRGHVFVTRDRGESWDEMDTGTESTLLGGSISDDGSVTIVGARGVVLTLAPGGSEFSLGVHPDEEDLSAGLRMGDGRILVVGKNGASAFTPSE